jgi:hypothetical protein
VFATAEPITAVPDSPLLISIPPLAAYRLICERR